MATITLRSVKGSPLTNTEVDNNFTNLNNDKLESSSYTASDVLTKIKTVDGTGSGLDADLLDGLSSASTNTVSTIVARDGSGNFAAGTITAALSGNADTATTLATGRDFSITGDGDATAVSFNGSGDVALNLTLDTVNSNVGSFGSASAVPVITVNGKGLVTAVSTASISSTLTISDGSATDNVTIGTDTLTFAAGTGITTAVTDNQVAISIPQAVATSSDVQFDSFGVGTAASGTTGEIRATNAITAFYSDIRLKENITEIPDALNKVMTLRGVTFNSNSIAEQYGYINKEEQVGVIAQEVEEVLPQIVKPAPFDIMKLSEGVEISRSGQDYKTVQYEKLVPLLIEAIKELNNKVESLQEELGSK